MNMERYARFAVGTSVGMFYSVAKPLFDLLRCVPSARALACPACAPAHALRSRAPRMPRHATAAERRKPQTGVPLVLGIAALTKLISWTLNAMLGLDPSVDF